MAVHGADVIEAQLLEQRAAGAADHAACVLVNLGRRVLDHAGQLLGHTLSYFTQLAQLAVGLQAGRGGTHRAQVMQARLLPMPQGC